MRPLIETFRTAASIVDQRRPWKWAVLLVLALGVAALEALGAALVFALVTIVSSTDGTLVVPVIGDIRPLFPETDLRTLQLWGAIAVAGFFIVRSAILVGQEYVRSRIIENAGAQVAQTLVDGYLRLPYLVHTQRNSSEFVRNGFDSAQRFVGGVVMPSVTIISEVVLVLALVIVLIIASPLATGIAIAVFLPTILLLQRQVQPRLKALGRRSQDARRDSLGSLQQGLEGIRDIQLLRREAFFAQRFEVARTELARSDYLKATFSALPKNLIETVLIVTIVAIFMVALLQGDGFEAAVATLGVFAYAGLRIQPSLQRIVSNLNQLKFASAILDDLRADYDLIARFARADLRDASPPPEEPITDVRFENVTFSYSGPDAAPALRSIDLEILSGEFIGICGPTGGGKSTFVDLLVGLLHPDSGRVLVNGHDLQRHERWWHAQLGVVSQSVFLIDDTLRANVAFGIPSFDIDDSAIQSAVDRAQLSDVVERLPDGLDTMVGERGIRLSGGQRQRVAIARALYLRPSVIVFDEGTSALDTATEAALVEAVNELRAGRTLVSVAHRVSTVRRADRILVISEGRIVNEGSYDTLLSGDELFQRLAQ